MANARLRKTGSGGIKFRRNFSVNWAQLSVSSGVDVVGSEGKLDRAHAFGASSSFFLDEVEFCPIQDGAVTSSTGRLHKVAYGQFFKPQEPAFSGALESITTFGAWCPNLPPEERLTLSIRDLNVDDAYEVRLLFSSGKKNGATKISIDDSPLIDISTAPGCVAVARFIATEKEISVSVKSLDAVPPFINAFVLRNLGTVPRLSASITLS